MAFLTGSWLLDLFLFVVSFLLPLSYLYFTRHFSLWKKLGIPFMKPVPLLGNTGALIIGRKNISEVFEDAYREAGDEPFIGTFVFDAPVLLVKDPDLIRRICTTDFSYFVNRNMHINEEDDPLASKTLFMARDARWKHIRSKLTVTFTSGKMKRIYPLVDNASKILVDQITHFMEKDGLVEILETAACYTTDSIGSVLLGIEPAALMDKNSDVRRNLRNIMNTGTWRYIKMVITFLAAEMAERFKVKLSFTEAENWIINLVTKNVNYRKEKGFVRGDFLDLLLHLEEEGALDGNKDQKPVNGSFTDSSKDELNFGQNTPELVAQVFMFLVAGFETSASTMTSTLFELSMNQKVQTKLRDHINEVLAKHNGEITYEALHDMPYLQMVISEAQRLYPPLGFLDRRTKQDYTIPGTKIVLPKDTAVAISLSGIQTDPRHWDQPKCFIPERFSDENMKERSKFLSMPFGEGPRICIGMRMGLMQVKAGLVHLIKNYEVVPHAKTPVTMKMDPTRLIHVPDGGLPLIFKKIRT